MSQAASTVSGSQSCAVVAKTDNAHSIVNILTAIHLKKDIVSTPAAPTFVSQCVLAEQSTHAARSAGVALLLAALNLSHWSCITCPSTTVSFKRESSKALQLPEGNCTCPFSQLRMLYFWRLTALRAMQEAYCVIDKSGFRFTVQKSNCLQANVYLKKDLFTRFECEVS